MPKSVAELFDTFRQARPPDPAWLATRLVRMNAGVEDRLRARQLIVDYANAHNANILVEGYMPGARLDATVGLAKLEVPDVVDDLLEWLSDWAPETRKAAILALGCVGESRAIPRLLEIALSDSHLVHFGEMPGHPGHYSLRCAAVLAIQRIGGDAAGAALAQVPDETRTQVNAWRQHDYSLLVRFGY